MYPNFVDRCGMLIGHFISTPNNGFQHPPGRYRRPPHHLKNLDGEQALPDINNVPIEIINSG